MRYKESELLEFNQNTIDDFYESTKEMIYDLLELMQTKICDGMKPGELYTRSRMLEITGYAIRYIKTFVEGADFQGEH